MSKFVDGAGVQQIKTLVDQDIQNAVAAKQDTLVSGTNIKTINGQSLLGSGNIEIQGGEDSSDVATIQCADVLDEHSRYLIPLAYSYNGSALAPLSDLTAGRDSWISAGEQITQQLIQDSPKDIVIQCITFKGTLGDEFSTVAIVLDTEGGSPILKFQATYNSEENAWMTSSDDNAHYIKIEKDAVISGDWLGNIHGLLHSYLMLTTSQLQQHTPYNWTAADSSTSALVTYTDKIGLILDQGNNVYTLADCWENSFSYRQVKLKNFIVEIVSDLEHNIKYRLKKPLDEVVIEAGAESIKMNKLPSASTPIQLEVIVDKEPTYYSAFCELTPPILDYDNNPGATATITINNTDRKIIITPAPKDYESGIVDWSQFQPSEEPAEDPVELTEININGSCFIDSSMDIIDAVEWPTKVPTGPFKPNVILKLINAEHDQYGYAVVDKRNDILTIYLLDDNFNYVDADMIIKYHRDYNDPTNDFTIVTSHLSRQDDDYGDHYRFNFDACALVDSVLTMQTLPEK